MIFLLRKIIKSSSKKVNHLLARRLKRLEMGFDYCHGDRKRLHLGKKVSTANTVFNTRSGSIYVGDYVIFGHNCMVLTGRHDFYKGKRKRLLGNAISEVPKEGYDIIIGKGCWISSGSIILGGVTIGDNSIVAAGSVVTKDVPEGTLVCGIPAKIKR